MQTREIKIFITRYTNLDELVGSDSTLIEAARESALHAYAPYSGFKVGAALRLVNGQIVTGNNQENASSPVGCCAERTALYWANANYPGLAVDAIAITAIDRSGKRAANLSPCGICRQALLETEIRFSHSIRILLDGADSVEVLNNAESLLPLSFTSGSL